MPRRVYTGREAACFADRRIGRLEPGEEFDAPEDLLEGLGRRADITVPAGDPVAGVAQAVPGAEDAETRAGRRRPGGRQPGGATAAETQQEAAP